MYAVPPYIILINHTITPINDFYRAKALEETENEIARWEATKKMYETQLLDPTLPERLAEYEEVAKNLQDTEDKLAKLYEKWEKLAEE